jgi:hypothetical protein
VFAAFAGPPRRLGGGNEALYGPVSADGPGDARLLPTAAKLPGSRRPSRRYEKISILSPKESTFRAMSFLSSLVLNAASGIIILIMAIPGGAVRPDYIRPFLILYCIVFATLLLVPQGGQVNAALAIGMVMLAVLSWFTTETDKRTSDYIDSKQSTFIVKGLINAQSAANTSYTTYDKTSSKYRHLPKSVNRFGGAQFTVSLWLHIKGAVSDAQVSGKTLFMRGDKVKYAPMFSPDGDTSRQAYFPGKTENMDYAIVCPRIHFPTGQNCSNKLLIDLNTDRQLIQRFQIGSDDIDLDLRKNLLSAAPNSWTMLTVTVEDAYDLSNFEKGIRVRVYVQDTLYTEQTAPGSLRMNTGPAHVLPGDDKETAGIANAFMSDVVWHNWALSPAEVARLYSMGFNSERAEDDVTTARHLHLDTRIKIDVSNVDAHIARNLPVNV